MASWRTYSQDLGRVDAGQRNYVRLEHDFSDAVTLVATFQASEPTEPVRSTPMDQPYVWWALYDSIDPNGPQWAVESTSGDWGHKLPEGLTSSHRRFVVPFAPHLNIGVWVAKGHSAETHDTAVIETASIALFIRSLT